MAQFFWKKALLTKAYPHGVGRLFTMNSYDLMLSAMMRLSLALFFTLLFITSSGLLAPAYAQKLRFHGNYPLATPKEGSQSQMQAEFDQTLVAILGGVRLMGDNNTPTNNTDPEAYTKADYQTNLEQMVAYAEVWDGKLGNKNGGDLKKLARAIKGGKVSDATKTLAKLGATDNKEAEQIYFIWLDYLLDQKEQSPWTNPENIQVTRAYRAMLQFVGKNYDRPFGVQAEQGAIVADAAQALSNCMENPSDLAWKGGARYSMKEGDELRRLVSNVSYYHWRLHDPTPAKRAALIDRTVVQNVEKALYDVVRSTLEKKENWGNDPAHGANLRRLFEDTRKSGWFVNGDKAQRQ